MFCVDAYGIDFLYTWFLNERLKMYKLFFMLTLSVLIGFNEVGAKPDRRLQARNVNHQIVKMQHRQKNIADIEQDKAYRDLVDAARAHKAKQANEQIRLAQQRFIMAVVRIVRERNLQQRVLVFDNESASDSCCATLPLVFIVTASLAMGAIITLDIHSQRGIPVPRGV